MLNNELLARRKSTPSINFIYQSLKTKCVILTNFYEQIISDDYKKTSTIIEGVLTNEKPFC